MRLRFAIAALLVSTGCTSAYDIRLEGRVVAPRPDASEPVEPGVVADSRERADLEPLAGAIVAIVPRFGPKRSQEVAHCGPADDSGEFRYASWGTGRPALRGISLRVSAPGFAPVERFVPATKDGRFDRRDLVVVMAPLRGVPSPGE